MSEYHRHAQVTATDRGPLVNVASWILMVTAILFTLFRLVSNIVLRGKFRPHDWIIAVATVLGTWQSIATSFAVRNGLGQHQAALSASTLANYQKSSLAAAILYVATFAATKLSLFAFLHEFVASTELRFPTYIKAASVVIGLYALSVILALSFSCNLPATYDAIDGKCINLLAFWDFHAVFDIVTSLTVFLFPVAIVLPLQMNFDLKTQVIFPFALELPLCVFAVIRLVYLHESLNAHDQTRGAVHWQIWTSVSMFLGIVAANIPCLKIFLEGFQSMLFRSDTTRLQTELRSYSGKSGSKSGRQTSKNWDSRDPKSSDFRPVADGESGRPIVAASASEPRLDTTVTTDPSDIAQEPGIYKTTEWTVLSSAHENDGR